MTGQTIAHYQVLEKLGEGGMGAVYKARDTHLNRIVAIKVLPPAALSDEMRRQRFIQEARAASAIDHPNIVTIYDVSQDQGIHFIVMQHVLGKTLRALTSRGRLEWSATLGYAIQIADALSQAHARGIIHRDLKPENIMVTEQGQVKILDFGLALLTTRDAEEPPIGPQAATRSIEPHFHTEAGTILGTLAYMSPEQIEGRKADGRSDIFSLGLVLYEMVTGNRAFPATTKASTIAAILKEEPKRVGALAPGLPAELERIIGRCLKKDPGRRFQHMDDLKVALDEIREESESGKLAAPAVPVPRRSIFVPVAIGSLTLAILAVLTWRLTRSPAEQPPPGSALIRLTTDPGLTTEPSFSPDGKMIAYASDRSGENNLDIWVQQLAGGEPHQVTRNPSDDHEPAFSPDGSKIAFRSEREGGGIYVVSTFGGTERKIVSEGRRPRFSPDGNWISYWIGEAGGELYLTAKAYIISSSGGAPRQFQPDFGAIWDMVWSADSKRVLFGGIPRGNRQTGDWFVAPVNGGTAVQTGAMALLRAQKLFSSNLTGAAVFQPIPNAWTGERIVFTAGLGDSINLFQLRLSKDFRVAGVAQRLTSGAGVEADPTLWTGPDKTRLVFSSLAANVDLWTLPLDPDHAKVLGAPRRLTEDLAADIRPSVSADGKKLVFNSYRSGNWDIWFKDLITGRETALTSTPVHEENPRISPDGASVIYRVREQDRSTTYLIPTSGGVAQRVTDECNALFPWAFDNRRFICAEREVVAAGKVSLVDAFNRERKVILEPGGPAPRLSWDDRWITFYQNTGPGRAQVFAAPVREGAPVSNAELIAVTDGQSLDRLPEFSPDGGLIYFMSMRDGSDCLWAVRLEPRTKKPAGAPFPVQHFHSARRSPTYVRVGQRAISIARDQVVFTMEERTGNLWMAELDRQN